MQAPAVARSDIANERGLKLGNDLDHSVLMRHGRIIDIHVRVRTAPYIVIAVEEGIAHIPAGLKVRQLFAGLLGLVIFVGGPERHPLRRRVHGAPRVRVAHRTYPGTPASSLRAG